MSLRPSSYSRAVNTDDDNEPIDVDNQLSDDDNAQQEEEEALLESTEDPLLLAIDDLEGRVVSALDDLKLHPGVRTSQPEIKTSIHDELAALLRPIVEVSAHTGPGVARTYSRGGVEGLEQSIEDVYTRLISDLVLPVVLEMAQSDLNPSKRVASLEFFRTLFKEVQKAGSWLDMTGGGASVSLQAGPYGAGGGTTPSSRSVNTPAARATLKRRQFKRQQREGELLRYWVEASNACLVSGVFTSSESEGVVASRGIIAASSSLRPSLSHVASRIKDADDRGASRLYNPVMKMVEGVFKKLFLNAPNISDALVSSCVKFLEIICLCCSRKPSQETTGRGGSKHIMRGTVGASPSEDFSLEDLPPGHPTITREALESISEYAFTVLRCLTMLGGQVKMDINLLSTLMFTPESTSSFTAQVISILKPAALAYLEVESSSVLKSSDTSKTALDYTLDRANLEFDFLLSQKSYALTINAVSSLALYRPVYFKEAAVVLARRAVQPPTISTRLPRLTVLALTTQLKGSCLTLLRNSLSVSTNSWEILHAALYTFGMDIQAEKALTMARQAMALKTAGRAARNRANMYYEWETDSSSISADDAADRQSKRQRETDDALAQMRAAKAKRGLGNGIQLPAHMTEAIELVLINLKHLPETRPIASVEAKSTESQITFDFLVDAVLSNGVSLAHQDGRWYDRHGGSAWTLHSSSSIEKQRFGLNSPMLDTVRMVEEEMIIDNTCRATRQATEHEAMKLCRTLFHQQCQAAAGDALGRILLNASFNRYISVANLGNQLAARLAYRLGYVDPPPVMIPQHEMAQGIAKTSSAALGKDKFVTLEHFVEAYPLVASSLAMDSTSTGSYQSNPTDIEQTFTVTSCLLNEAYLHSPSNYDQGLDTWVASVVQAGVLANEKPTDIDRKRVAGRSLTLLQREFVKLPRLTKESLLLVSSVCNIEGITKKSLESSRTVSQDSLAASSAIHAAKVAAERRATLALLILRDTAFQRSNGKTRRHAIECAVALATGRLSSTPIILDKALKLCMNILFAKSPSLADLIVECATFEMEYFTDKAIQSYTTIQKANQTSTKIDKHQLNPLIPQSDEEKAFMDMMRRPALLYMALCIRRPELIETLFRLSSRNHADVLSKTVKAHMSKLSRAAVVKFGTAEIANRVASMTSVREVPLLLSFLENLAPGSERNATEDELITACLNIQELKSSDAGKKDCRFIIPVVSVMRRKDLIDRLSEFVAADDKVFLAALVRMGDRLKRLALLVRDEADEEKPVLRGMTLCEQLVYLHRLDFAGAGLPQKRYISAINLCLEDSEVYNDRIVMSALDHMSGDSLTNEVPLPLAFMRTVILTCTKYDSLRSWIARILLPRLVEGRIFDDARQWEGWMRCTHMIEKTADPNATTLEAISKLPAEQIMQYQTKWMGK